MNFMRFTLSVIAAGLKRALSLFLAMLLTGLNGIGIRISMRGHYDSLYNMVSYSFYDPTYKLTQRTGPMDKKASYTMYLAKNEREACQIAFRTRGHFTSMQITMTDFKDKDGNILPSELYKEEYVSTSIKNSYSAIYPDALVPVDQTKTFDVNGEISIPYYINVRSTKDTPAGDYTAEITFRNSLEPENKRQGITVEVKAHVWDFTLPDTPSSDTAFGLNRYCIAMAHGVDYNSDKAQELYEKYYEFLVDHKISPYSIPVDLLSPEAEKYMDDPRITSFIIPYTYDDELLQKYYARVNEKAEWAAKAYFYPIDEPNDAEAFERYLAITERLDRLCPGYNMVTPYSAGMNIDINGETYTSTELESGKSSILCPVSWTWNKKGAKEELYASRENQGSRLWWYVCCAPLGDYCNLTVNQEGLRHRILFWQQKSLGIEGLLYWDTAYWSDVKYDPWSSSYTVPWTGTEAYGDGSLLYNGNRVGIDGPVSSLRLEGVTNGLEDYDYLTMAEELLGKKYTDKTIKKITKNLKSYTYSDETFANVRIELGNAIEKAVNS